MIKDNGIPRVKIVAIAKDEAAYFAEWIHHHLYFGFDAIDIYLNRTTDNSKKILSSLSKQCNNINYFDAGWVDLCPAQVKNNLQYIIYSKALNDERLKKKFDYIFFLDIDEFWSPRDASSSIQEVLKKNNFPECISFQWINEIGSQKPFSNISESVRGYLHPLVKSIVKVDAEISSIGFHLPKLVIGRSILVDGSDFKSSVKLRECLSNELSAEREVMIIHRMFRSKMEYISLLSRGRPSDDLNIKLNRSGYNKSIGEIIDFVFSEKKYDAYEKSRFAFLSCLNTTSEYLASKKFIELRYTSLMQSIELTPIKYAPDLLRVFRGLNEFSFVIEMLKKNDSLLNSTHVDILVAVALACEKHDLDFSIVLIKRASKIRPKGPLIRRKLVEYGVTL